MDDAKPQTLGSAPSPVRTGTRLRHATRAVASSLCHLYPLKSGCGTIANSRPFRTLAARGDPEVVARVRGGGRLYARLDDYVGRAAFFFGELDPKVTAVCRRYLRPGDIVLDVGANIGLVTMHAARIVGPTGHVHAVEPQADLAALVAKSAELNGYANVTVHTVALSDVDGEMRLSIPSDNSGAAVIGGGTPGDRTVTVPVRNAGIFLTSIGARHARLLKLDVEGHESIVLEGATSLFAKGGPEVVLFEEHGVPSGDQRSVQLLESFGYRVLAIPKAKFWLRLLPIRARGVTAHDFVAIRQDGTERRQRRVSPPDVTDDEPRD